MCPACAARTWRRPRPCASSSRAEPFGERFLREALRRLLQDDVPGVRRAYLEAAAAVRERRLGARDVSSLVRLTKRPEEYLSSRARRQEIAYEALLGAGRTTWATGERVRVYRRAGGAPAWLPDHDDAASARADYDAAHYLRVLRDGFASRLEKAFEPRDFERLFRLEDQDGLFDAPIAGIRVRRVGA
jgi:hypothetical protein